jgi:hypothetical protein
VQQIESNPRSRWRRCALYVFVAGQVFSAAMVPASAQTPVSQLTVRETIVVRFAPSMPSGNARDGSCWTDSIAVSRSGAYRCSVGNGIYDPCFTVPTNHERMVCGADPALRTMGFVLKLTKPLPETPPVTLQVEPWIIKLADGSICEAMTGTLPAVNGQSARWSCAIHIRDQIRPVGVVTALTPGKIWMADKFPESAIGTAAARPEKVPVKAIWE